MRDASNPLHPAEKDAAIAEALAHYAPMIWEAGRNAGVLDAMREHGPSDEQGRLLWMVMTPRTEENPYEGVPFDFTAHDDPDAAGQSLAEHYRDAMSAKRELTPDDEEAIEGLLTRDLPPGRPGGDA